MPDKQGRKRMVGCLAPWTHFYIMENGYGPCCDVTFPIGNRELEERLGNADDFLDLFNSNSYINLRQAFLEGNIPYSCKVCMECGYNREYDEEAAADIDITSVGPHVPRSVSLVVESPCNISCVFCKSIRTARDPEGDFRTFRKLFDRLEEIGWDKLDFIRVGGGEPFFNPGFNRFIQSYDWSRLGGATLKITTNATLLHKVLDELADIPKVDFTFSVDATGDAYEALRRGSSWERVRENLGLFSSMMHTRPGWRATIHSIVMKTSLPRIAELMDLAAGWGFGYSLMNLHGKYYRENIFLFPDLLRGWDWEGHAAGVLAASERHGFTAAHADMARFREHLRAKLVGRHTPIRGFSCCDFRLQHLRSFFADMAVERFALIGLDDRLIQLLQSEPDMPGLECILDRATGIGDFMGRPFLDADALPGSPELARLRRELDHVVVCCPTYQFDEYSALAKSLFPDNDIRYAPFFDRGTQANIEAIARMGEPLVAFCTGGAARMLLEGTALGRADIVAFAENNARLHGTTFRDKPVIRPDEIADYGRNLVILSDGFSREIADQVRRENLPVNLLPLF